MSAVRKSMPVERRGEPLDDRKRYFDPRFGKTAVRVLPGEHYVSADSGEMIVTVLGSCVSACIRDPFAGVAGMNHFMLPESDTGKWGEASAAMRYGNYAMEVLINDLLRLGARRDRLEIKLFGGGHVGVSKSDVGTKNAAFAEQWLHNEGLGAVATDLGGNHARRIHYFCGDGTVKRLYLKRTDDLKYVRNEESYREKISRTEVSGTIELFD